MNLQNTDVIKNSLEQLGLSAAEISLYQASLRLGAKPASILARTVGLQRTRAYDVLHHLESRGLMERIERNKIRYFSASSPERVLALLDQRQNAFQEQIQSFKSILPQLLNAKGEEYFNLEVRRYRGAREIKDLLSHFIDKTPTTVCAIGDIENALQKRTEFSRWVSQLAEKRIKKNIRLKVLAHGETAVLREDTLLKCTVFSPSIPANTFLLFDGQGRQPLLKSV